MDEEALVAVIADIDRRLHNLEQKVFAQGQTKKCAHGHVKTLTKSGKWVCQVCARRTEARKYDRKAELKLAKEQAHYHPGASLYEQLKKVEAEYRGELHSSDGG